MTTLLLALDEGVMRVDEDGGEGRMAPFPGVVSSIGVDREHPGIAYASTWGAGLWRTDDNGFLWERCGHQLDELKLTRVVVAPSGTRGPGTVYVGTEPSALYRSTDRGEGFEELEQMRRLPSHREWSFPPRPNTSHVWTIAVDPSDPDVIHAGIELGGVVSTFDGGRTWRDRRPGHDYDCHTLRMHPAAAGRIYEAGGACYCESRDHGETWGRDLDGIPDELRYFYSLAVDPGDPDVIVMTASRDPFHGHHNADSPDAWATGYRRSATSGWAPIEDGFPGPQGHAMGWFTTDERTAGRLHYVTPRGAVYRSVDAGRSWDTVPWERSDGPERLMVHGAEVAA